MQHFKQILSELVSYNVPEIVKSEFNDFLSSNFIDAKNINICVVENFIKNHISGKPDNMLKYQLLNKVIYNREKPSASDIQRSIEVFQAFIYFIQDLDSNFTMKYDFYVMKIFQFLKIDYNFSKREFKDNTKKNKDSCYWYKFIKYGLKQYQLDKVLAIPEDDQDF